MLPPVKVGNGGNRFAEPKSDAEVEKLRRQGIPANTIKGTKWALNVWCDWTGHRRSVCPPLDCPPHLYVCTKAQLSHWLSKFVVEVRRKDGKPYPPQSLYQICCGLLRYVRDLRPEVYFFTDSEFRRFQQSLNAEMKRLRSQGIGFTRKRAEPISVDEEMSLWEKGVLGDSCPQVLLDTMVYCCGVYFALRSGEEHRSLKVSQLELVEPVGERAYVRYTENVAKNNHGGFSQRKLEPKQVVHHANLENPSRCFIRLYKTYLEHRPDDPSIDAFYLTALKKPKGKVWYSHLPVGHNTLSSTMKRLCGASGLSGCKTNHSLRVTAATRLFQSGAE